MAVAEGRLHDVPVPTESFAAWCPGPGLDADELRGCIQASTAHLPEFLATVGAVWSGEGEPDSLPPTTVALLIEVCRMRRRRIERDYEPVPGGRRNIFYEVQGVRRPEALGRLDLMRRLNGLLARYGSHDPDIQLCLGLDLAAEAESRGEHDTTRQHLEEVRRAAALVDDAPRREYAEVCIAEHHWQRGEVERVPAILADLTGERAAAARRRFDAMASARAEHRAAVEACHRTPGLEAWSVLAHAEMAAGHSIAGERTAQALTRAYPGRSFAWTTLARILHDHGRHRDAVAPARESVRLTDGTPESLALLAEILARIGDDGRQESIGLAERVIVEMVRAGSGPVDVLATVADVVGRYADRDRCSLRHAHAADDLIWAQRDTQTVSAEWFGAAASRRCQSVWAPDAMLWLGRLAAASDSMPAAVARWVVDRVDVLARMLLPVPACPASDSRQILSVLLQAAFSLGYGPDQAADVLGLSAADLEALAGLHGGPSIPGLAFQCRGTGWHSHLAALDAAFGPALVVRLRASEVAQCVLHSGEGAADTDTVAAVARAVLQSEQIELIRWSAEQPRLRALQSDHGESLLEARTRARLVRIMALATLDDDELLVALQVLALQEPAK